MGTADWQLLSIFQDGYPSAELHDLDDVYDTSTVNKDKLRRIQFIENLL